VYTFFAGLPSLGQNPLSAALLTDADTGVLISP